MTDQHFRLSLQSTYEESEKVPAFVTDIQKKTGLNDDATNTLMLLLSEAVTNAIVHGNNLESSKKVEVDVEISENKIVSMVKDEGTGFDPGKTDKDPLSEDNLMKEGGRGIFLINELSDEVEYSDGGTKIRFSIKR